MSFEQNNKTLSTKEKLQIAGLSASTALILSVSGMRSANALPLGGEIDFYRETQLNSATVNNPTFTIDSGYAGKNPGIFGKVKPTESTEIIGGITQNGRSVIQASGGFKVTPTTFFAPYINIENGNSQPNNLGGLYIGQDLGNGLNLNGFVEKSFNGNSGDSNIGWRVGLTWSPNAKK
jgi:hypothetical protein